MILLSASCMSPFTASPAFSVTPDGSAVQKFLLGLAKAVKGTSLDHLDLQIPLLGISITGNLVPKLLSYGLNVQGRSCHHVNHRVSKSSSHAGGGEESNSSGACENTLGREILVAEVGSVFLRLRSLMPTKKYKHMRLEWERR